MMVMASKLVVSMALAQDLPALVSFQAKQSSISSQGEIMNQRIEKQAPIKTLQIRADDLRDGDILASDPHYGRVKVVSVRVLALDKVNPNNSTIRTHVIGAGLSTHAANMDWRANQQVRVEDRPTCPIAVEVSEVGMILEVCSA
jgi:hypothetical protein